MYIIKNAFRCIGRSKGRNSLIGIIALVIAIAACIGLSIRQAAQSTKKDTLSAMSVTATISVDRQSMMGNMSNPAGGGFDKDQFADMFGSTSSLTLEEYEKYASAPSVKSFYYTVAASFNGSENFEAVTTESLSDSESSMPDFGGMGGMGNTGGMFGRNSGDFTLTGYSTDEAMTSFINGTSAITSGAVFDEGTEKYDCIISEELATYNDLSVGDTVNITNPQNEEEIYALTVVGIYSDSSSNESLQAMPGSDPANNIYLSANALNLIISASEEASKTVTDENTGREYETKVSSSLSATYVMADAEAYYSFENEVRELGLSESYSVSSQDISEFENSLVPLNTLSKMSGWFLIVILIIGAIILVVLNIFNIRERKYEIGVLMAIGMKKGKVASQFMTEIFAVTLAAVIIGIGIGAVSAVPVTNALLENQINSSKESNDRIEQGFGGGNRGDMPNIGGMGNMGGFGGQTPPDRDFGNIESIFGERAANYISEINSAMNLTVVLQMLGIAVLLTLIAGTVSILFVMRYEPLKILANRD